MKLSKENIDIVRKNKSQFVSLKYLDDETLKQVDAAVNNIEEGDGFISSMGVNLRPIANKNFIDPFRSFPTTSFFCENLDDNNQLRKIAIKLFDGLSVKFKPSLVAEISFWALQQNSEQGSQPNPEHNYIFAADPVDKYANLRSDIVATLENINIKTSVHFHGKTDGESVIGIKGDDIIDLSDNIIIAKFIIANLASSYGLSANFVTSDSQNYNLLLIVSDSRDYIDKLIESLRPKVSKNLLMAHGNYIYKVFEDQVVAYRNDAKLAEIKINFRDKDDLIPYISFVELLYSNIKF